MYHATTRNIEVTAKPQFLESHSDPSDGKFVWAYTITIANNGPETVRLVSRHWVITDAQGHQQEVKGPGVVGEQPLLKPGDSFTYSSGCPLSTPSGLMIGTYQMVTPSGEQFDVQIPAFSLDSKFDHPLPN